jgi:hypothetical protein
VATCTLSLSFSSFSLCSHSIAGNGLTAATITALIEALPIGNCLQTLNVSDNELFDEGASALARGFTATVAQPSSSSASSSSSSSPSSSSSSSSVPMLQQPPSAAAITAGVSAAAAAAFPRLAQVSHLLSDEFVVFSNHHEIH